MTAESSKYREDTEDKTEIVVKKTRTVITPTTMAQIKKIASFAISLFILFLPYCLGIFVSFNI